jgi:hypothetical protein
VTILLIYFTLLTKEYFRVRFPTPSGMDIYGLSLKMNSQMNAFDQCETLARRYAGASRISSSMILMGTVQNLWGSKNGAWHIEKGRREYGLIKISVFHRFSATAFAPQGRLRKNTDRPMTFNWMEVLRCQEKPAIRMSQSSDCLAGDF